MPDREHQAKLIEAATGYIGRGLPVFPCKGKTPLTKHGFQDASTDTEMVLAWWQRWPEANVAMPTGSASGVDVVDVDTQHGGAGTLATLERDHGKLPTTVEVLTPCGGKHYWFAHTRTLKSSAGTLGPGVDTRGEGGYVVLPPSTGENGRPYKLLYERELAELPDWVFELVDGRRRNGSAPATGETIPEGERDTTLTSLGGTMRRRGMDEAEILAALKVTNEKRCKPPLPERDVERIAASIAGYPSEKEKTEEPFALPVLTARALCALPDPPESDELLGPLVVRGGRLVLGAHTGEGKTTLALQIVRAIVLGEELLEWTGSGGVRALVIDAEQGLKTIKRRLREAGLDDSELVDYVCVPDGLELDENERHIAEVQRLLNAGDYGIVCADPLYKLHAGDSNAEREAVDLMRRFDAWRAELRFALLLPVHCRKPVHGAPFSIHDLVGSSAYVRGAEVVLGLQRARNGYAKLHWLKDRDGDLPIGTKWGLAFDREQGFRRDPDDGKPSTSEQLAELRAADPAITQAAAAKAIGVTDRTIRKYWHDDADDEAQESLLDDD